MSFEAVQRRLDSLTKPPGSLGRLEDILLTYAWITGKEPPVQPRLAGYVFCADHGVVAEGVSAWPSAVTRQMVRNFAAGGAAINVLCRHYGIEPFIIDMGVQGEPVPGVRDFRIAPGTRNFAQEPAMTAMQAQQAIDVGKGLAMEAAGNFDLLLCGEMGIGNTTAATALLCAYSGVDPERVTGAGAGLDANGVRHKTGVIRAGLTRHSSTQPLEVAAAFGGFEILAIAGMILGAAEVRIPVILDGFISCSAALIVNALHAEALKVVIYSHCSAEKGHKMMLEFLNAQPLLDLEMRLGEGTGAAMAAGIFQAACRIYYEMATFDQAQVG
ncbi:MAG TPA: nicotinate-nucleotide--dimethylbenzimidazole phosphoribosyltransferase [Bryobacteraceae bacterium]|nr:nicotinate-nucleotide--dimethylbenzimidazole phosphoribosyltransferase [Bryobacteraceae bacterium]